MTHVACIEDDGEEMGGGTYRPICEVPTRAMHAGTATIMPKACK